MLKIKGCMRSASATTPHKCADELFGKKLNKSAMTSVTFVATVVAGSFATELAFAQAASKGLPPAANTYRSFVDASIVRDSEINQPLDLLNDFYPAIEVSVTKHDNIRRRPDVEESDTRLALSPSLAYRSNIGRHQFYAAYSGTFTFHDELEQEDATANRLVANLGLDLTRRWDLNVFAGVGESYEERGVSGSRPFNQLVVGPDGGPDKVDYSYYGADLVYGRKVSPLIGVIGFEKHTTGYQNNFQGDPNPSGGRDRDTDSIHLDLSYKIGSKTSIFGRVQRHDIDYDRTINSLDSEQTDFLVGIRWKPSSALAGVIGVGDSDKDFDDPAREDYSGSTYYANLNYMISPFSVVEFSASRSVEEPGDDRADYYVSDLIGVGWDHALNEQWVFNVFAKRIEDDYDNGREDKFFDYGVGLDYLWKSWLTAGIYYGQIERDSTLNSVEYEDRYFGIRIRSDLRSFLKGRKKVAEPDSFEYPRLRNRQR